MGGWKWREGREGEMLGGRCGQGKAHPLSFCAGPGTYSRGCQPILGRLVREVVQGTRSSNFSWAPPTSLSLGPPFNNLQCPPVQRLCKDLCKTLRRPLQRAPCENPQSAREGFETCSCLTIDVIFKAREGAPREPAKGPKIAPRGPQEGPKTAPRRP